MFLSQEEVWGDGRFRRSTMTVPGPRADGLEWRVAGTLIPSNLNSIRTSKMLPLVRFAAFLVATLAFASTANAWSTPRVAVERFLKFEMAGGRLSAWPFHKYLAVADDYDEPGWDMVEVVESWRIGAIQCSDNRTCRVSVTFAYARTASAKDSQIVAHPTGGTAAVAFVAVEDKGQWLLESSNGTPRISVTVYRREHPGQL